MSSKVSYLTLARGFALYGKILMTMPRGGREFGCLWLSLVVLLVLNTALRPGVFKSHHYPNRLYRLLYAVPRPLRPGGFMIPLYSTFLRRLCFIPRFISP